MAEQKAMDFRRLVETILGILREKYPPDVLATMAVYALQTSVSDGGLSEKRLTSGLEQHHIEILQALALTLPSKEWGVLPATPNDIQGAMDSVRELTDAFHQRRLRVIESEENPQVRTIVELQERLRMHTQMVRNWGYFSKVIQISLELYGPLDDVFHKA